MQTYDVMGKHLSEFKCVEGHVPEIFVILFDYFREKPGLIETEGLFRLSCDAEEAKKLESALMDGQY